MLLSPFFLSAFAYLSPTLSVFTPHFLIPIEIILSFLVAIFSPIPLLIFGLEKGIYWSFFAGLINCIAIFLINGTLSGIFFFSFVVIGTIGLLWGIHSKKSPEITILFTLFLIAVFSLGLGWIYSIFYPIHPLEELRAQIEKTVGYLSHSVATNPAWIDSQDLESLKRSLLLEFPSNISIFSLFLILGNWLMLVNLNPSRFSQKWGIEANFVKKWKAPESLVWPSIVTGLFILFDFGVFSNIAKNIFNFLMAIYVIQGLSILSYFFDLWKLREIFKWGLFVISLFIMMPFVLSLGFFDLWFDFRSKFRQS